MDKKELLALIDNILEDLNDSQRKRALEKLTILRDAIKHQKFRESQKEIGRICP